MATLAAAAALAAGCTGALNIPMGTPLQHSQKGPFYTSCGINPRGIAVVAFRNNGGRNQTLHNFRMGLTTVTGKRLKTQTFTVTKGTVGGGHFLSVKENVTYRADKCLITRVR